MSFPTCASDLNIIDALQKGRLHYPFAVHVHVSHATADKVIDTIMAAESLPETFPSKFIENRIGKVLGMTLCSSSRVPDDMAIYTSDDGKAVGVIQIALL